MFSSVIEKMKKLMKKIFSMMLCEENIKARNAKSFEVISLICFSMQVSTTKL